MADPYANQYPPPPPAAGQAPHHAGGLPSGSSPYDAPHHGYESPSYLQHQTQPTFEKQQQDVGYGYNDPQAVPLSEYNKQQHMEAQRQHDAYQADYYTPPPPPPDNAYHNNAYYTDEPEYPASTPMVQQQQNYQKSHAGPTLVPDNEAESYRPKPFQRREHHSSGCNCCCYNPEMTCCACYCFILSLGFLAAGIILIIASSVIQGKCQDKCDQIPDQISDAQDKCAAICSKVVHDGMLYSGIGVTALAGLAVVWRLIMCFCGGCSRR